MKIFRKIEVCAGLVLLLASLKEASAGSILLAESLSTSDSESLDGPNILGIMIQDGEKAVPPTPVTGGYIAALVIAEEVQANWLQSEIGIQLIFNGEKLDPRRYHIDWKLVVSPYSVARLRLTESNEPEFSQKIQLQTPLNNRNAQLIGAIEIEALIYDREQPDKPAEVLVQTLRELLQNGRDGL